jgi:CRP-like cAMP-binding protein/DNA-binding CsgD family transcriptional regulator
MMDSTRGEIGTMQPQTVLAQPRERLDILEDLPRSKELRYLKGQVIYDSERPATHLYLVIEGRVKVIRTSPDGPKVLLDVYKAEELFGESSLLSLPHCPEMAAAIEPVTLMAWTPADLYGIIQTRPQLGVALSQMLVQRLIDCQTRVESFAVDRVNQRLARMLIRLADKQSESSEDGAVRISGLKHQLLSDYVVTTRATVTHWMNCFRHQGLLRYSGDNLFLYPDALKQWLDCNCLETRPGAVRKLNGNLKKTTTNPQPLTAREQEVLGLVTQGLRNREIAQRLCISEQTVKNHLQNVFEKLGASNRYQASSRFARLYENQLPAGTQPLDSGLSAVG